MSPRGVQKRPMWRPVEQQELNAADRGREASKTGPPKLPVGKGATMSANKSIPVSEASTRSSFSHLSPTGAKMKWADMEDDAELGDFCIPIAVPRIRSRSHSFDTNYSDDAKRGVSWPQGAPLVGEVSPDNTPLTAPAMDPNCAPYTHKAMDPNCAPFESHSLPTTVPSSYNSSPWSSTSISAECRASWAWDPYWEQAYTLEQACAPVPRPPSPPLATESTPQTAATKAIAEAKNARRHRISVDAAFDAARNAAQQHELFLKMNANGANEAWWPEDLEQQMAEEALWMDSDSMACQGIVLVAADDCVNCDLGPGEMTTWPANAVLYSQEDIDLLGAESFQQFATSGYEQLEPWPMVDSWAAALCEKQSQSECSNSDYSACQALDASAPEYNGGMLGAADYNKEWGTSPQDQCEDGTEITTLMIHNIPNQYTRQMLVQELGEMGFENKYDFVHLPVDQGNGRNISYAFVNFTNADVAKEAAGKFDGYQFSKFRSQKRGGSASWVSWAHLQGLMKNVEHYRNTLSRPLILCPDPVAE